MTRVLTRAPLLRLERVVLESPTARPQGDGEEAEEGSEEGEGEHAPSPRQMLRAVIPAGGPGHAYSLIQGTLHALE